MKVLSLSKVRRLLPTLQYNRQNIFILQFNGRFCLDSLLGDVRTSTTGGQKFHIYGDQNFALR